MVQSFGHKLWSLISILSLDVVLGAMGGMYFFQQMLDVSLPIAIYFLLACAVWVVYTVDHLVDAGASTSAQFSDRHAFHQRYRIFLVTAVILVSVVCVCIVWFIPVTHLVLPYGIGLSFLIACWYSLLFFFKSNLSFLKEILIAFFYTVGISLAPFIIEQHSLSPMDGLISGLYFFTALINLSILSFFDRKYDQKHNFGSIGSFLTELQHKRFCLILMYITLSLLIISLALASSYYKIYFGILLLMVAIHYREFNNSSRGQVGKRWLMEIAFSLPWILLLF
jgi:hypothetical protein